MTIGQAAVTSLPTGGCHPAGWLELPLVGPPGLRVASEARRDGPDGMDEGETGRAIRVVVVDDEAVVRSGFELILARPRTSRSSRPRAAATPWRPSGGSDPTWCCWTSGCRTSTGSTSCESCGRGRTLRWWRYRRRSTPTSTSAPRCTAVRPAFCSRTPSRSSSLTWCAPRPRAAWCSAARSPRHRGRRR